MVSLRLLSSVFLLTCLFLLFTSNVDASPTQWFELYGGALDEEVAAIVQVDGGYVIAGTTHSFGAGSADFWLMKVDADGNLRWNYTYGGPKTDVAADMVKTSDGGYAVAGKTYSIGADDSDFCLVKVDPAGDLQWIQTYGRSADDGAKSLIQTRDGGFALVGSSMSNNDGRDVWLVKTDHSGNLQWNRTFGMLERNNVHSVIQTDGNGYMLAGSTSSHSESKPDGLVIKTDPEGRMLWNKTYDRDGGFDYIYAVVAAGNDGFVFAGNTGGFIGQDVWLFKINSNGRQIWETIWNPREPSQTSSLLKTSDGGLTVTGYTESLNGLFDFSSYMFLVKVDGDGGLRWNSTYPGLGDNKGLFAVETSNERYALAGSTKSTNDGSYYDIWLAQVDGLEQMIPEFPSWMSLLFLLVLVTVVSAVYARKTHP